MILRNVLVHHNIIQKYMKLYLGLNNEDAKQCGIKELFHVVIVRGTRFWQVATNKNPAYGRH